MGPSLGGGGGGASLPSPEVGEVLPRLAFPTSRLKEKWLSPSLLDNAPRRTALLRSQCLVGDSSVVVNDMDFQENRKAEEEGDGGDGNCAEESGIKDSDVVLFDLRSQQWVAVPVARTVIVSSPAAVRKRPNALPVWKVNPEDHPFLRSPSPCRQEHREQCKHRRPVRD